MVLYLVKLITKFNYKYHVFHFKSFLGWGGAERKTLLTTVWPGRLPSGSLANAGYDTLTCLYTASPQEFLPSHFHSTAVSPKTYLRVQGHHCSVFRGQLGKTEMGQEVSSMSWVVRSLSLPAFLVSESCYTLRWVRESPVFLESWDLLVPGLSCIWALRLYMWLTHSNMSCVC